MRKWILALMLGTAVFSAVRASAAPQRISQDSINKVIQLANNGDGRCENIVGTWYYTGENGLERDYERAFKWYGRSAKHGNAMGVGNMGLCYQTGNGVAADSLTAVKLYKRSFTMGNQPLLNRHIKLADAGNVFSAMMMSECYEEGVGVGKDKEKSLKYLEIAANKGSQEAVNGIGLRFLNARKPKQALVWFKKGMENGDVASTYYYGKMLLDGNGTERNPTQGFDYLLKAAREGFPAAQYAVGTCFRDGIGTTANQESAYEWIGRSAASGWAQAQYELGLAYAQGSGIAPDYRLGLIWLTKAADNGWARRVANLFKEDDKGILRELPFFNYVLGMNYLLNGADYQKALDEFKIVAKAKEMIGKTMEGVILGEKNYAKYNAKKSMKTLKDAAKTDVYAQYLLGKMYETTETDERDMTVALEWLKKSADAGCAEAQCYLGDIYYEGRGVNQNYNAAVDLYRKAAAQGLLTQSAATRLASCYEEGLGGLSVDLIKATQLREGKYDIRVAALLMAIVK